ncbi:MAG: 30S ribosomal protein S6 [Candidatus Gastranaerophilales bacterium]|nr:30S ribosomal protein S6 [Candidatus Gastranaerophilales bacterium]
MKKYDILCIIKTNLDIESVEQVIKNIEDSIKNFGGNILNVDKLGRKKLGYEIEDSRDGFYVNFVSEIPADKVADLKRYFKLNENVIRALITVQQKLAAVSSK